jgi:hypothetical protein
MVTSLPKNGQLKELHQILSREGEKGLSGFILFFTEKIQGEKPKTQPGKPNKCSGWIAIS